MAYSVTVLYSDAGKFWYSAILCLCDLGTQVHCDIDTDKRGTYLTSEIFNMVSAWISIHYETYH